MKSGRAVRHAVLCILAALCPLLVPAGHVMRGEAGIVMLLVYGLQVFLAIFASRARPYPLFNSIYFAGTTLLSWITIEYALQTGWDREAYMVGPTGTRGLPFATVFGLLVYGFNRLLIGLNFGGSLSGEYSPNAAVRLRLTKRYALAILIGLCCIVGIGMVASCWDRHFGSKRDGIHVRHYRCGALKAKYSMHNGKKDGKCTRWFRTGEKSYEYTMSEGEVVGLSTGWYQNGQVCEVTSWTNGMRHGRAKRWNRDGSVREISHYVNGVQHGPSERRYVDGGVSARTMYVNGKREGVEQSWNRRGEMIASGIRVGGVPANGTFVQRLTEHGRYRYVISTYEDGERTNAQESRDAKHCMEPYLKPDQIR